MYRVTIHKTFKGNLTEEGRINVFFKVIQIKKELINRAVSKEILKEAEQLEVKNKAPIILSVIKHCKAATDPMAIMQDKKEASPHTFEREDDSEDDSTNVYRVTLHKTIFKIILGQFDDLLVKFLLKAPIFLCKLLLNNKMFKEKQFSKYANLLLHFSQENPMDQKQGCIFYIYRSIVVVCIIRFWTGHICKIRFKNEVCIIRYCVGKICY